MEWRAVLFCDCDADASIKLFTMYVRFLVAVGVVLNYSSVYFVRRGCFMLLYILNLKAT